MTRDKIIDIANSYEHGGFANTDGKWCECKSPEALKEYIESLGFVVIEAKSTKGCTARLITEDGYVICYNGACYKS